MQQNTENRILAEYIWTDGLGNLRSKTRVVDKQSDLESWNFDGSSTEQAGTQNSEVVIRPVKIVLDPFKGGDNKLVLCDTWVYNIDNDLIPHETNSRHFASKLLRKCPPGNKFGFEQEFYLVKNGSVFNSNIETEAQGKYYCGIGYKNTWNRKVIDKIVEYCMLINLPITGMNAEVGPNQWEIQVCSDDIDAGDNLLLLRYIIERVSEDNELDVSFHPKPLSGDWNGSGCHTNFSNTEMRSKNGINAIMDCINKFEKNTENHIEVYGDDNDKRLTGEHETAPIDKFSWGYGDRGASIRVPKDVKKYRLGYFEDRRPASNIDPYKVIERFIKTLYDL